MPTQNTPFDFGSVSVTEAEMPTSTGAGRPRKREHNPFVEPLAASYEAFKAGQNSGRQIRVPGKQVTEAVYLIRQASDDLKVGARIILQDKDGKPVEAKDVKTSNALVTVLFSGKERRKAKAAAAATEAPAADSAATEG